MQKITYFHDKHTETHTHALASKIDPQTLWQWLWHASSWRAPPPPPPLGSCASSPWVRRDMIILITRDVYDIICDCEKINSTMHFNSPKGSSGSHHHHHHKREGWQTNENSYLLDWRLPLFRSGRSRGLVLPPTPSPPLISPTWKHISQYRYVVSNIQDLGFLPSFGWKWSRIWIPHIFHGRHGRRPCNFFLAGINFYRFNAKNWQFTV